MIRIRIQIEFSQIDCEKRGEAQWDKVQVVWRAMKRETQGLRHELQMLQRPSGHGPSDRRQWDAAPTGESFSHLKTYKVPSETA